MATVRQTRSALTGKHLFQSGGAWSNTTSFRLVALLFAFAAILPQLRAQDYQITSATPSFIAANANGATLTLVGKLPSFPSSLYQICFYTGYGSTAAITPNVSVGPIVITIPASTIQSIPTAQFPAANGYALPAQIYIVPTGTTCTGSFDATLTDSFTEPIAEPLLGAYSGPTGIPQTNPTTSIQASPANIVLSGSSFAAGVYVTFGTFGNITPKILSPTTLSFAVPAAFASSPVGTTAAVGICNTDGYCGTGAALTLTVSALAPSVGALTITPTPVTTIGTTTLTAQFKKNPASTGIPEPGAPSGTVTFSAGGQTVSTAALTLDNTAIFVPQTTTTQIATTAVPVISPAAGTYANSQTVTIANATPGASIFYTLDSSFPNTNSTLYSGPITVATTQTVTVIAIAAGSLPSAPAANLYTIFVPIPTSLSFVTPPSNTAINTTMSPAVTVAVFDQNNNIITNSTAPVSIAVGANPGPGKLGGTLSLNAVNGIATFSDLTIDTIANGYTLTATSGTLKPAVSTTFNITPYPSTVQLFDPLIGVGSTLPGTITLAHPAPGPNNLTVNLTSVPTSNVTVSATTISIPPGGVTGSFTYTGVAPGPATISASAAGYLTGSATVTATNSLVSLGTIPAVAPGQTVSLALSIATAAPAGGVTVNFTSSNPTVATVTPSVFIPAGQRTAAANPQIVGLIIGTTTITATAENYAPDTRTVNVTVVATFKPTNLSVNLATSNTATLNISAPAQVGGLTFTVSSDAPNNVSVASSVTIPQGQTSVAVPITGVKDGTSTTIRADSSGVIEATLPVSVSSKLSASNVTTGVNLEVATSVYVPVASPSPVTVTVTSTNPAVALLSKSSTAVGTATVTFTNVTSLGSLPSIYVQGQAIGNTTLTYSAPGYTSTTVTVTVGPSGFTFGGSYSTGLATTTLASPSTITIYPTILTAGTLAYAGTQLMSPGAGTISVPVTSSNTVVGTITTSPVIFNGGDSYQQTTFQPSTSGTTTIAIGAPSPSTGFSTPSQYTSFTATVTAPVLSVGNVTTGVNLENIISVYVPATPPPGGVTVTVTSNGPGIATISKSGTMVGGTTLTFPGITSLGSLPPIYVQGQVVGTTTITVSAPEFTSATSNVTVDPSGFTFAGSNNGGLSTTTFSAPSTLTVYPSILAQGTLNYLQGIQISPGVGPISVPVTSSNTVVGTITTSPVIFNGGDNLKQVTFQPTSAGKTTISLDTASTPPGFSTPSQYTQFIATVTAPTLTVSNVITGAKLQVPTYIYVPVAPPNPVTVTVTSNGPAIATISDSGTVVGGTTLTFTNVTSIGNLPAIYVQGQATGSTTLTASAAGYTNGIGTITVNPSGFTFAGGNNGGLNTTATAATTSLTVYPTILTPNTFMYSQEAALNPGLGGVSVPVTSSNTSAGTITISPLIFDDGATSLTTAFQPKATGSTTITIGAPTGFSTPSQYQQINATVQ